MGEKGSYFLRFTSKVSAHQNRTKNKFNVGNSEGPLIFLLLKRRVPLAPTPFLWIKRSGTPPSLPTLGVAPGSGVQKSATL